MSDKIVKSVGRVFHVLELFDHERRALTAIEIATKLDYPLTSTHAILKSMLSLKYLVYIKKDRTFLPSTALSQIVDWVFGTIDDETTILNIMAELHEKTRETINLSRQTGNYIKIVHGLESSKILGIRVSPGAIMPLTNSHTGMVALATHSDYEAEKIIRDLQKRNFPDFRTMSVDNALKQVRTIRKEKITTGYDVFITGIGIVCFALQCQNENHPFMIAVAGPTERIRNNEKNIISAIHEAVENNDAKFAYPN